MKKLFSKLMLVALAALTFVACEDVPEPYNIPGTGENIPGTSTEIEGGTGTGTVGDPFNAVAAINFGKKLTTGEESDRYYYIKGKVVSIREEFTTQYGNGTFYISEDGTAKNQFYAYRVQYLGNQRFADGDTQIQVGDEVVVCGIITNYNGTIETTQGKAFLYSLNGVNRGGEPKDPTPAAEPTGDGTLANPYNVSGVLKYIATLGSDINSPSQVYVKGKVSRITEEYGTQFGNGTFYISDDGEQSNEFYAFRVKYLGNKNFANGDTQIKVGDEVIICGNVVNYRGNTPETVQNAAFLYSLNGVTAGGEPTSAGEPKGDGTLANPFNAAAAIAYAQSVGSGESDKDVYIKGKVSSVREQYGTQYGNGTFYISDDGTDTSAAFYVFRALYLGNQKYTSGTLLKQGDEVIVCGRVTNYMGNTPETVQAKAYLYSLNGDTGSGETPQPQPSGEAKGDGTEANPFNSVAANAFASALASGAESDRDVYIAGKVVSIKEQFGTEYGNATFWISDDGSATDQFYVFRALYLGNEKYTGGDQLQKGDDVVICGRVTNYMGNTPETAQGKAWLVSMKHNGSETPQGGGGEVSGNSITVDFPTMGYENAQGVTTVTLTDGTTLTFGAGTNRNAPKYYDSGTAVRMYPTNTLTVTAASGKTIAAIALTCSANNAEGNVTASPGTVNVSGMDVTVSAINAASTTITNAHTGTGAASQLRILKMVITYAE